MGQHGGGPGGPLSPAAGPHHHHHQQSGPGHWRSQPGALTQADPKDYVQLFFKIFFFYVISTAFRIGIHLSTVLSRYIHITVIMHWIGGCSFCFVFGSWKYFWHELYLLVLVKSIKNNNKKFNIKKVLLLLFHLKRHFWNRFYFTSWILIEEVLHNADPNPKPRYSCIELLNFIKLY